MLKIALNAILALLIMGCAHLPFGLGSEVISGITIMSYEDLEQPDGSTLREVRGSIGEPLENDEEWVVAVHAIWKSKRIEGQKTVVRVFLDEDDWETGKGYAVAKFNQNSLTSLKIENRMVKVSKTP